MNDEPIKRKSKGLSTAAFYSGVAARNDNKERAVPEMWQEYTEEWLSGYDDIKSEGPSHAYH